MGSVVFTLIVVTLAWFAGYFVWMDNRQHVTLSGVTATITIGFAAFILLWMISGQNPSFSLAAPIVACITHAILWLVIVSRRKPTSIIR